MNASCRMALLLLLGLVLTACASMEEKSAAVPEASPPMDDDQAYIAKVEALARRRGVDLVWVNPPRKAAVKENEK